MLENALIITTTVLTSLLAGLFFAYSVSVNSALRRLTDREYVRAMQSINQVIQNPLFFLVFMGPVILLPIVTLMFGGDWNGLRFLLLACASAAYILGSFGVTVAGNVPLNEALAKVDSSVADTVLADARARFESPWNRLHTIRTVLSVVAAVLATVACTTL